MMANGKGYMQGERVIADDAGSHPSTLTQRFGLDAAEQSALRAMLDFHPEDAALLDRLRRSLERHAHSLETALGEYLARHGGLQEIAPLLLDRAFVEELLIGDYSDHFFESRLRIGERLFRSGVPQRWCLGVYSQLAMRLEQMADRVFRFRPQQRRRAREAVLKVVALDVELTLNTWARGVMAEEFADYQGQIEAIGTSQGVIEFRLDGSITSANANALQMFGYTLDELRGKHHSIIVDPAYAASTEYRTFWERLNRGEFDAGEYKFIAKGGKEIWTQSTYNPILDDNGRPFKIVKYANDITFQKRQSTDYQSRVRSYSAFIDEVAHGNLRQRVNAGGNDELSQIGRNLNAMTESLARMAGEVNLASNEIFGTLGQLQEAVNAQSAGASQQAAAVNETTVTLEEIMATSTQTLAKAQHLGESAERTRREAELGLLTVKQTIAGMEAIRSRVENIAETILALSEQTQQIGEITSVVTNLAQQSKMLAFNASIEAAKAGEAGRGFAVVAAEVKDLAEQSQQSTAQVQKILQDIRRAADRAVMATEEGSKGVDAGVDLVQKSGEVMRQLSAVVHDTALSSQQIVAAVRQEVAGIKQVTTSMSEINRVTAQFVAGTQEVKTASTRLGDVAGKLRDGVSVYKL